MSKTKHITINRAPAFVIAQCTGELFEAHGLQFCITNSVDPQIYGAIELSTGALACERYTFDYLREESYVKSIKRWIKKNKIQFREEVFEAAREVLSMYQIDFPLNHRH